MEEEGEGEAEIMRDVIIVVAVLLMKVCVYVCVREVADDGKVKKGGVGVRRGYFYYWKTINPTRPDKSKS